MDAAKLSMAFSQSQIRQEASLALMNKAMGQMKQQGNDLIQMLEKSAPSPAGSHPTLGKHVDIKA
ncbi:MAG: YjfB family protein [Bacillaceae bacterium]|nr:YjfB family protein [Bacillaceae bacterium]